MKISEMLSFIFDNIVTFNKKSILMNIFLQKKKVMFIGIYRLFPSIGTKSFLKVTI